MLRDVMAGSGLHVWAEVALVLVVATFAAILAATLRRANRETFERASRLPLQDDAPAVPGSDR